MRFHPSKQLLWAVFGVALLATLAGPFGELAPLWLLALAVLALVCATDLALSLRGLVFPEARIPALVRLTKDREGRVPLSFHGGNVRGLLRFALGLPSAVRSAETERCFSLDPATGLGRLDWACTPSQRGHFEGLLACFEATSLLGLWSLRRRQPLDGCLRVYPNLFSEKKTLAAIFLPRSQFGARLRKTVGRGREFEKLRDYQAGDPYDEIHWKATAKRGNPVTKVFQSERTQEVYVVIDASRLSARVQKHEGIEVTTLERYLNSSMLLLLAASRQGDRFGLIVFDSRIRVFIRAAQGPRHYAACRDALHALRPAACSPDVPELVRHLRTALRQRALLFFLTDLTDPVLAEDYATHLGTLSRQHLVLVNQLRPPGVAPLFEGAELRENDEVYGRLAGHLRWSESRALIHKLRTQGVTARLLESETLAEELLTQYMQVKERQHL